MEEGVGVAHEEGVGVALVEEDAVEEEDLSAATSATVAWAAPGPAGASVSGSAIFPRLMSEPSLLCHLSRPGRLIPNLLVIPSSAGKSGCVLAGCPRRSWRPSAIAIRQSPHGAEEDDDVS